MGRADEQVCSWLYMVLRHSLTGGWMLPPRRQRNAGRVLTVFLQRLLLVTNIGCTNCGHMAPKHTVHQF